MKEIINDQLTVNNSNGQKKQSGLSNQDFHPAIIPQRKNPLPDNVVTQKEFQRDNNMRPEEQSDDSPLTVKNDYVRYLDDGPGARQGNLMDYYYYK